jgi:F420H(2)-dependent quinone reductase
MWFNPFMEWILKSPLHTVMSGNTMILYYNGCKSGKAYHTPVGYQRTGDTLLTTSWKDRTWWKNFRDACEVKVLLQGNLLKVEAQVFEDEASVAEGLRQFMSANPRAAGLFKIHLDRQGQPDPESLQKAARLRVIIRTTLI